MNRPNSNSIRNANRNGAALSAALGPCPARFPSAGRRAAAAVRTCTLLICAVRAEFAAAQATRDTARFAALEGPSSPARPREDAIAGGDGRSAAQRTAPASAPTTAPASAPAEARYHDLSQGESSFEPGVPPQLEVKRVKTGHLLVRPRINGREAGWFIFDTGAGICVVSTPHKDEFELTPSGDIRAVGTGGGETAKLYHAAELAIGPLTLRDHPLMATDLTFLRAHLGEEIAGVLGYGVLSRCVAEFDIEGERIALHDREHFKLPAGQWSRMPIEGRVPVVIANFEDHEGRFMLDTGANSAVVLYERAVRKWDLTKGRALTDSKLGGVGGFVAAKKGTLAWIELGGVRRENVAAEFALEAKGASAQTDRDGRIGAGLLREYVLYLDYAGERIGLAPRDGPVRKAP